MRRRAVQLPEVAHEVVARQAGHARQLVERQRLGVAALDAVGGQAQPPRQLGARGRPRRRQAIERRAIGGLACQHRIEQQQQLLLEPVFAALAGQRLVAQGPQPTRQRGVVAPQVLGELARPRRRIRARQRVVQALLQRAAHLVLHAGPEEHRETPRRPALGQQARVAAAFVEDQVVVVVDHHLSVRQVVAFAPAPGRLDRQRLRVQRVLGPRGAAADQRVLAAPAREVPAPECRVRRRLGPRRQVGHRGQDHREAQAAGRSARGSCRASRRSR